MAILGAEPVDRNAHPLRAGGQQLAPHPGADDADRVPQHPGVVRATGDLGGPPLLVGRGQHHVHLVERRIQVVGHHHAEGRDDALTDVLLRQLGEHSVVGLDLDPQVVNGRLLAEHEDVGVVLDVRRFIRLYRKGASGAVGEADLGGDRQGRPGDQKPLEDCSTLNGSVKRGHSGSLHLIRCARCLAEPVAGTYRSTSHKATRQAAGWLGTPALVGSTVLCGPTDHTHQSRPRTEVFSIQGQSLPCSETPSPRCWAQSRSLLSSTSPLTSAGSGSAP